MAERISDNVGKKIVEALKMQNSDFETEAEDVQEEIYEEPQTSEKINEAEESDVVVAAEEEEEKQAEHNIKETDSSIDFENLDYNLNVPKDAVYNTNSISDIETAFQNSINNNIANNFINNSSDIEIPNNVVILSHLITKLPTGVTKQTGAVIIRQTMEALGIPMKSVIQEARQVQDELANKARDCQKNILELKKQIASLEMQSQQYQRQAVVMNDIINLFAKTDI